MEPIKDPIECYPEMNIMRKYEEVISYLYPIAQRIPRQHGVVRDMFLRCLLAQPDLFYQAGKSNQILGHRHWARYMDDIVILGNDLNQLREDFKKIEAFSSEVLKMRISKWQASPISQGINFLGYRIWPTHKLIRKDSVKRAKRKIARYVANGDELALQKFVASWRGHAQHADTCNLFNHLEKKYGSDHHQYP